ncbi:23S rRNA pseudouridine(2604) synthase RluF [Halocola ammonii]
MSEGTRINKYLSEIGYCSRREGDKLIEQGRVTINGKVPEMGTKVMPNDTVAVDGRQVSTPTEDFVYLAYHKPVGVVCTTDSREKDNIIRHVNYPKRIFPIGRLDKPSEGLIFLTNDGDIVNKILRSRNNHEKEYEVAVDKPIKKSFIEQMANGLPILDTMTKKCFVEKTGEHQFRIILTQGLNRQIRRMCEYLGYNVTRLKRVRIMNIPLDIPLGEWRYLTDDELKELKATVSKSTKEAPTTDKDETQTLKKPGKSFKQKKPGKETKTPFAGKNKNSKNASWNKPGNRKTGKGFKPKKKFR